MNSQKLLAAILFTSNKMAALCSGWVVRCCSRTAIVQRSSWIRVLRRSFSCLEGRSKVVTGCAMRELSSGSCSFLERTHMCGELRAQDEGKQVTLCGWVQPSRLLGRSGPVFVPLRDHTGTAQLVVLKDPSLRSAISALRQETVVQILGTVHRRPHGNTNVDMATGEVEVHLESLHVLNHAGALPFSVSDKAASVNTRESLRLAHRYLDLRGSEVMDNLKLRSAVSMAMRKFLVEKHSFLEVETPTLFKLTPEGAREFLVPTRTAGRFYSLAQSPQQFKQLLMVGGVDRYFQLARCYRDEDLRADRQPEFTQLDLEMSFVTQDGILGLVEELMREVLQEVLPEREVTGFPFPRVDYREAMERYGSDKPDPRIGMDISAIAVPPSAVGRWKASAFVVPGGKVLFGEDNKAAFSDKLAEVSGAKMKLKWCCDGQVATLVPAHVGDEPGPDDSQVQLLAESARSTLSTGSGDLVVLHCSARDGGDEVYNSTEWRNKFETLGRLRLECAGVLQQHGVELFHPDTLNFLWIVNFPLFIPAESGPKGALECAHHPFTAPHPDYIGYLDNEPTQVVGQHYDLILNGVELGGGSIRIHQADLQERLLREVLKVNPQVFAHLLRGLQAGCPPHGGIAIGFDRFMAILCKATSLRDVIAFPKSFHGQDLLTGAPSEVSAEDLQPYHIHVTNSES